MLVNKKNKKNLSFWEHLEELRWIVIRSLLIIILVAPFTYWCAPHVVDILVAHCSCEKFTLQYFTLMEPFFVQLKVALILALFISFPYIAYQFWKFLLPALVTRESIYVRKLLIVSTIMFGMGVSFAYYLLLPMVVRFSLSFQRESLQPMLGMDGFINMVLVIMLAFGVVFQLPVIVSILVRAGVIKKSTMTKQRPLIIVVISIISAILTPPDFISQLIMGIPTYLLFEISLLISKEPKKDYSKDFDII